MICESKSELTNTNSIEMLLDIIIKDLFKPEIDIIELLIKIYNVFDNNNGNSTYINLYKKIKDLDKDEENLFGIIYSCLKKNKLYKSLIKEYEQLFVYNNDIIEKISDILKKISENKQLGILNLFCGVGNLTKIIIKNTDYKYINCYDNKQEFIDLLNLSIKKNNINFNKTDIIHSNDIKDEYELIITDIPDNIKNIIFSQCCDKIKNLKIRGTKSEPLILHLIISLLKVNGTAISIISNSFLFGDSIQHIATRKYIYENSSSVQVINLKNTKKSILIFTKNINNHCDFIDFSEEIINNDKIIENNYSFYFPNYVLDNQIINNNEVNLDDIINIIGYNNENNYNYNVPLLYSYNNFNFEIGLDITEYDYVFITKNERKYKQEFLNNYLPDILQKNIHLITKGKTNIFNIESVKKLKIKNFNIDTQISIINFNKLNNKIRELNNKQCENLSIIKKNILDSYQNSSFINLSEIVNITNSSNNENTIIIYKNSNLAGHVDRVSNVFESNNLFFINLSTNLYLNDFIFYYLKLNQDKFVEFSKINNSVNLAKKYVENFKIPEIDLENQQKIINLVLEIENIESLYKIKYNTINNLLSSS